MLNKKSTTRSSAEIEETVTRSVAEQTVNKRKLINYEISAGFFHSKRIKIFRKYDSEYLKIVFSWNGDAKKIHDYNALFMVVYLQMIACDRTNYIDILIQIIQK